MAVLAVKTYGEKVLREISKPIEKITPEIVNLVKDMTETMYTASGVGLAAPQVGVAKRIIIIDDEEKGAIALINPEIIEKEGEMISEEGCLSLPELYAQVKRFAKIKVESLDLNGEKIAIEAKDLLARVIQHEIDHLNGILFIDKIGKTKRKLLLEQYNKKDDK